MNMRGVGRGLVLAVALGGASCAPTMERVVSSSALASTPAEPTVLVLPADAIIGEIGPTGRFSKRTEWSDAAQERLTLAVLDHFDEHGGRAIRSGVAALPVEVAEELFETIFTATETKGDTIAPPLFLSDEARGVVSSLTDGESDLAAVAYVFAAYQSAGRVATRAAGVAMAAVVGVGFVTWGGVGTTG